MTQTSSAMRRTMPRSWVMNSIAMPSLAADPSAASRICACTVTSSAVVGSSAISRSGSVGERHRDHHALALPARHLVRIGVEPAGSGCRPSQAVRRRVRARAGVAAHARAAADLADLPLDRVQRIERGHRLLKDHGDRCRARRELVGRFQQIDAVEQDRADG
jgi:hypothetical protein